MANEQNPSYETPQERDPTDLSPRLLIVEGYTSGSLLPQNAVVELKLSQQAPQRSAGGFDWYVSASRSDLVNMAKLILLKFGEQ